MSVHVHGSDRSARAVTELLSDLFPATPSATEEGGTALEDVACAAAASRRLFMLGCFKSVMVTPAFLTSEVTPTASANVTLVEPALKWTLGLQTTATTGRKLGATVSASLRNVLGSLASLDARVGVGSAADSEFGGELSLARMLFPHDGRAAVARARPATVEALADAATGTPRVATLGLRATTEDRTKLADVKRRVVAVFASLRAPGPQGTFNVELAREAVTAGPDAAPALALAASRGTLSQPRLRIAYGLGFDRLSADVGEKTRKIGAAACLTSELGLGGEAEYIRETAGAEAHASLGTMGVIVSVVGRVGALLGLRSAEPTAVAAGLEGFGVGTSLVRCMVARMPHTQAAYRIPVSAFASLQATIAAPIPFVPAVAASNGRRAGMHLFVDAGGITHTPSATALVDAALRRPRITAGAGLSLPIGSSGRIELNLALPIARHPQDTAHTFDFGSAPSYL